MEKNFFFLLDVDYDLIHPMFHVLDEIMTEIDYYIDQVQPNLVAVHVSGTVLRQANRSLQSTSSVDNYFYDRPRTCKRTADGKSFDCTRYVDMHIDNGLLCGVYEAPGQVYRPCFEPVP